MPKTHLTIPSRHQSGSLTVIGFHHREWHRNEWRYHYECLCDCGNTAIVRSDGLKGRHATLHCRNHTKGVIHGMARTPEYRVWASLKQRCLNPKFPQARDYSERGIAVCQEWIDDFMAFYSHVGRRPTSQHTIERINNNKGYEPGNVEWATRAKQARNTRRNIWITFDNTTRCHEDWASHLGITAGSLSKRLRKWPLERALTEVANTRYQH